MAKPTRATARAKAASQDIAAVVAAAPAAAAPRIDAPTAAQPAIDAARARFVEFGRAGIAKATAYYDEVLGANRRTAEALFNAGNLTVKGAEANTVEALTFAKHHIEDTIAAMRALIGAKTYQEVLDVQAEYTKSLVENLVAEGTRFNESVLRQAQSAVAPIGDEVRATFGKLVKPQTA